MEYYSTNYDEILEEERKNLEGVRTTQQDAINKTYDENRKNTQNTYNSAVNNTEIKYESDYERNAVQKLINEKMIAERNANLGLTDSGLNRMQQTAVQMSYANQKGALDIAKQGALDELSQNLALSLSNIEQNRVTALADLDANIETQAQSNAIDRYNANVEANAEMWKAQQEAAIARSYASGGSNYEVNTAYYRGPKNLDAKNGTFKNGYQPDNVNGSKLTKTGKKEIVETTIKYGDNAGQKVTITQNVWIDEEGKEWIWDGVNNKYIPYD